MGPVCRQDVDGGSAVVGTTVYLPCLSGVVAVRTAGSPPSLHVTWSSGVGGGPPIVAAGLVWTIGRTATLSGLDPSTGSVRQRAADRRAGQPLPDPECGRRSAPGGIRRPGGGLPRLVVPSLDDAERRLVDRAEHEPGTHRHPRPGRRAAGWGPGRHGPRWCGRTGPGGVAARAPAARPTATRVGAGGARSPVPYSGRWPGPGSEPNVPVAHAEGADLYYEMTGAGPRFCWSTDRAPPWRMAA